MSKPVLKDTTMGGSAGLTPFKPPQDWQERTKIEWTKTTPRQIELLMDEMTRLLQSIPEEDWEYVIAEAKSLVFSIRKRKRLLQAANEMTTEELEKRLGV